MRPPLSVCVPVYDADRDGIPNRPPLLLLTAECSSLCVDTFFFFSFSVKDLSQRQREGGHDWIANARNRRWQLKPELCDQLQNL